MCFRLVGGTPRQPKSSNFHTRGLSTICHFLAPPQLYGFYLEKCVFTLEMTRGSFQTCFQGRGEKRGNPCVCVCVCRLVPVFRAGAKNAEIRVCVCVCVTSCLFSRPGRKTRKSVCVCVCVCVCRLVPLFKAGAEHVFGVHTLGEGLCSIVTCR